MPMFRQLVNTTAALEEEHPDDWQAVNATLVPLAALALHSADRIDGLSEVLAANGWRDGSFDGAVDLYRLKKDLWVLFSAHKERELIQGMANIHRPVAAMMPAVVQPIVVMRPTWDPNRPFESFRALAHSLQHGAVAEGQLLNELTHYAQVAINQARKQGMDAEPFKATLIAGGWNQNHHAFLVRPDMVHLLACLHHSRH